MSKKAAAAADKAMRPAFDVRLMTVAARVLLAVFALLLLGLLARWFMQSSVFEIRGLTLTGDVQHSNVKALRARVMPQIEGTFLTVDLKHVQQVFETQPWVRHAIVRREFPNRLRVILEEHQAAAWWKDVDADDEDATALVNRQGEVFEANLDEVQGNARMPLLSGPEGRSAEVLALQRAIDPLLAPQNLRVARLTLNARGNWELGVVPAGIVVDTRASESRASSLAQIELGSGTSDDVLARLRRFLDTAPQVAAHHQRDLGALSGADLRYPQGYALKLKGVSTAQGKGG
jgi:cell division protein FtsQ